KGYTNPFFGLAPSLVVIVFNSTLKMINLTAGNSKSFFSKSLVYQGIKEYIGNNFRAEIVTYVLKKEENRIFRVRKTIKK
ncbi:hypothetical protein BK745_00300, partial [Bacillus thuringiensis serovar alesti]